MPGGILLSGAWLFLHEAACLKKSCSGKQWPAPWLLFQLMAVMKRILLVLACICLDLICRSTAFHEPQEFDMLLHRNLAALYASGILRMDDPALDEVVALDFGDDERLQMGWRWKSWSAGAMANPCMAWNRRGARLDCPVCQEGGKGLQEHWALRDDGIPQARLSGLLGPAGRLICCPPETAKNPFVPPLIRCSLFFWIPNPSAESGHMDSRCADDAASDGAIRLEADGPVHHLLHPSRTSCRSNRLRECR